MYRRNAQFKSPPRFGQRPLLLRDRSPASPPVLVHNSPEAIATVRLLEKQLEEERKKKLYSGGGNRGSLPLTQFGFVNHEDSSSPGSPPSPAAAAAATPLLTSAVAFTRRVRAPLPRWRTHPKRQSGPATGGVRVEKGALDEEEKEVLQRPLLPSFSAQLLQVRH
jgi:hypothetical protein